MMIKEFQLYLAMDVINGETLLELTVMHGHSSKDNSMIRIYFREGPHNES
jgi:hypothetical protein